jgi:hypothetical protein
MADSNYLNEVKGVSDEARRFSVDMLKYNTHQAMDGQAVDGATKVTNNWVGKPDKIQTTQ